MRIHLPKGVAWYVFLDYLFSIIGWVLFVFYRRTVLEQRDWDSTVLNDNFWYSLATVPIIWILIFIVLDSYKNIYRLSRLNELARTLFSAILGAIFLFFTVIIDDLTNYMGGFNAYYYSIGTLFSIQFILISLSRLVYLSYAFAKVKNGVVSFNTIFIGKNQKAVDTYLDIVERKKRLGYQFIGYVDEPGGRENPLADHLPRLGGLNELSQIINQHQIEEVIVALDRKENKKLRRILNILDGFSHQILIKVIPDMYDFILGKVKMNNVYGAVLIEIQTHFIPIWVRFTKRAMDIFISTFFLILSFPLLMYIAIRVKISSKGPVLYRQKRIGLYGSEFFIYKFRSMYVDAENEGPQLSSDNDNRITPWGLVIRKYRLDELPQFWNVLRGDMSLVGPRPERRYYLDQIANKAPQVYKLQKVRPGITSWGQVKFGYASNIDEMIQRLKFDILYIENLSLSLDIKILFNTVLVILKGSGK